MNCTSSDKLQPHEQLLVWFVARVAGAVSSCPSQPSGIAQWKLVEQMAEWHHLLPLFHHLVMHDPAFTDIPASIREHMTLVHARSVAWNLLLESHLCTNLKALEKADVQVIVLKGLPLEKELYSHTGLRSMSDIDLMVKRSDIPCAEAVLCSLGYVQPAESERREGYRENHHHLAPFVHRHTGAQVDLHTSILSPARPYKVYDMDEIWQRAQEFSINGANALKLAPTDQLLHLCLHFLGDRLDYKSGALRQICDIALFLNRRGTDIQWTEFARQASYKSVSSAIHLAFYATRWISGVSCPTQIYERLQPADFDAQKADLFVRRRVVDTGKDVPQSMVRILSKPGVRDKVKGISHAAFSRSRQSSITGTQIGLAQQNSSTLSFARFHKLRGGLQTMFRHPIAIGDHILVERWLAQSL